MFLLWTTQLVPCIRENVENAVRLLPIGGPVIHPDFLPLLMLNCFNFWLILVCIWYMFTYMNVCYVDECVLHVCVQVRHWCCISSMIHLHLLFETVYLLLSLALNEWLRYLDSGFLRISLSFLPQHWGYRCIPSYWGFWVGYWGFELRSPSLCSMRFIDSCLPRPSFPFFSHSRKGSPVKDHFQEDICQLHGT